MHTSILSLEAAGLLERRARNQRVVLVGPTEARPQTPGGGDRRVRAVERTVLGGLSAEEERSVRAWLADLAARS